MPNVSRFIEKKFFYQNVPK